MIVGVDFDNTIVTYDQVMNKVAKDRGLIGPDVPCQKRSIRDAIRSRPGGEWEWMQLQAAVYGPLISEAKLIEGVEQFFKSCRDFGVRVFVISHKTEFAAADETGTNLRLAAMDWMSDQRFFSTKGAGFTPNHIYFEDTRQRKVERIAQVGCTHFIDDLLETFLEPGWPGRIQEILYSPHFNEDGVPDVKVCPTWKSIEQYLFANYLA